MIPRNATLSVFGPQPIHADFTARISPGAHLPLHPFKGIMETEL